MFIDGSFGGRLFLYSIILTMSPSFLPELIHPQNSHPLQGSSSANQPIEVELQSNSATRSSNPPLLQPQCQVQIETTTVKMPTRAIQDEADGTLAGQKCRWQTR